MNFLNSEQKKALTTTFGNNGSTYSNFLEALNLSGGLESDEILQIFNTLIQNLGLNFDVISNLQSRLVSDSTVSPRVLNARQTLRGFYEARGIRERLLRENVVIALVGSMAFDDPKNLDPDYGGFGVNINQSNLPSSDELVNLRRGLEEVWHPIELTQGNGVHSLMIEDIAAYGNFTQRLPTYNIDPDLIYYNIAALSEMLTGMPLYPQDQNLFNKSALKSPAVCF